MLECSSQVNNSHPVFLPPKECSVVTKKLWTTDTIASWNPHAIGQLFVGAYFFIFVGALWQLGLVSLSFMGTKCFHHFFSRFFVHIFLFFANSVLPFAPALQPRLKL